VNGHLHTLVTLTPRKALDTHWTGVLVGLRDGVDTVAKRKKSLPYPFWELAPVVQP